MGRTVSNTKPGSEQAVHQEANVPAVLQTEDFLDLIEDHSNDKKGDNTLRTKRLNHQSDAKKEKLAVNDGKKRSSNTLANEQEVAKKGNTYNKKGSRRLIDESSDSEYGDYDDLEKIVQAGKASQNDSPSMAMVGGLPSLRRGVGFTNAELKNQEL